jgi:hypothetical protein
MKLALALSAFCISACAGAAETTERHTPGLPDPAYCAGRDADPQKCVIQDGPPNPHIIDRQRPAPRATVKKATPQKTDELRRTK